MLTGQHLGTLRAGPGQPQRCHCRSCDASRLGMAKGCAAAAAIPCVLACICAMRSCSICAAARTSPAIAPLPCMQTAVHARSLHRCRARNTGFWSAGTLCTSTAQACNSCIAGSATNAHGQSSCIKRSGLPSQQLTCAEGAAAAEGPPRGATPPHSAHPPSARTGAPPWGPPAAAAQQPRQRSEAGQVHNMDVSFCSHAGCGHACIRARMGTAPACMHHNRPM